MIKADSCYEKIIMISMTRGTGIQVKAPTVSTTPLSRLILDISLDEHHEILSHKASVKVL